MPLIHKGNSWQFGKEGKRYYGKNAKAKAMKQMRAIEFSKHKK